MAGTAQITLTTDDFDGLTITAQNGKHGAFGAVTRRDYQWAIQGDARELRLLAAALAEAAGKAEAAAQLRPVAS